MANLTEDLIIGILLCLPVKSIARFRCVSKSWFDLLTHEFVNKKVDHDIRKGNLKLITTRRERCLNYKIQMRSLISDNVVKMRYPFNELLGDIQILGSCNGLICATRMNHVIYVWNPCTTEYKLIPPKKPIGFQSSGPLTGTDHISYGFAYDSKTSDYKFVSIFSKRDTEVSRVDHIYTLGSDSWKTSMSCIPYKLSGEEPGVFVNGALRWLANTFTSCNNYKSRAIVSFDLEEEIFKEIPLPEEVHMNDFDYRFVDVLRGRLCLLCSVSKVGFEIWEMKNYGVRMSWTKLFKTDPQLMMALDVPFYHYLRSAVFLQNGEILLQIRLHDGRRYSSSFEWQKRSTVVRICWEEENGRHHNIYEAHGPDGAMSGESSFS